MNEKTTAPSEKPAPVDLTGDSMTAADPLAAMTAERDLALNRAANFEKELVRTRLELKAFTKRTQSLTNEVLNLEFQVAKLEEDVEMYKSLTTFQEPQEVA